MSPRRSTYVAPALAGCRRSRFLGEGTGKKTETPKLRWVLSRGA